MTTFARTRKNVFPKYYQSPGGTIFWKPQWLHLYVQFGLNSLQFGQRHQPFTGFSWRLCSHIKNPINATQKTMNTIPQNTCSNKVGWVISAETTLLTIICCTEITPDYDYYTASFLINFSCLHNVHIDVFLAHIWIPNPTTRKYRFKKHITFKNAR